MLNWTYLHPTWLFDTQTKCYTRHGKLCKNHKLRQSADWGTSLQNKMSDNTTSPFLRLWYMAKQFTGDVCGSALWEQGPWTVWVKSSQISWIGHLGAMQAQPDLCGCTGVAWDVIAVGARAFFWTAGMVGTAGTWLVWDAGVTGAAGVGCICCAGSGSAGCTTEKWCLVRACSVAVVPLGTVLTALTLHSQRCLCMVVCGTIAGAYLIAIPW